MLRLTRSGSRGSLGAVAAGAALLASLLGPASPAHAAPGDGLLGGQTDGASDGQTLSVVAVHLSGNGLRRSPGSDGGTPGGGTVPISVPVPCYWTNGGGAYTGQKFYDTYFENGRAANFGVFGLALPSNDEIAAHQDDDGTWYWVGQTSAGGQFSAEEQGRCDRRMQAANGSGYVFVPAGEAPPPLPPAVVPAEVLAEVAYDNLAAPAPVIETNPGVRSFVRLPTWFWVENLPDAENDADGFVELIVTATAGPVTATVTAAPADPNGLRVSVPANGAVVCTPAQAHTAWSPGAADAAACALTPIRSSATQPGERYTGTAITAYDVAWAGVEADGAAAGGPLLGVTATGNFDLQVAEVQAVVQ